MNFKATELKFANANIVIVNIALFLQITLPEVSHFIASSQYCLRHYCWQIMFSTERE